MKRRITILFAAQFMLLFSANLFSQSDPVPQEFGLTAGGFTNFPANHNYLTDDINVIYLAPYVRTGQHEFSAGILYPLATHALYFTDHNINPGLGAIARYKFYIFNVAYRENLFIHYSFQYIRFTGTYDVSTGWINQMYQRGETDMYINNVIGLGYSLFFDTDERFGFYYTLDYVICQAGYNLSPIGSHETPWITDYIWNNLSTHFGFSFKLSSLNKKDKN
jgi:hypothetical protein